MKSTFKVILVVLAVMIVSACSGGPEEGVDYINLDIDGLTPFSDDVVVFIPDTEAPKSIDLIDSLKSDFPDKNIKVLPMFSLRLKDKISELKEGLAIDRFGDTSLLVLANTGALFANADNVNAAHITDYWSVFSDLYYQEGIAQYYTRLSPKRAEDKILDDLADEIGVKWFGKRVDASTMFQTDASQAFLGFHKGTENMEFFGDRADPVIVLSGDTFVATKGMTIDQVKAIYKELI